MTRTRGYVRVAIQLAVEASLFATVGSLFWIAIGRQVVQTQGSTAWNYAGGGDAFLHFFVGIIQLYLLYRLVRWAVPFTARRTAQTVDGSLKDLGSYGGVRERMLSAFRDRMPVRTANAHTTGAVQRGDQKSDASPRPRRKFAMPALSLSRQKLTSLAGLGDVWANLRGRIRLHSEAAPDAADAVDLGETGESVAQSAQPTTARPTQPRRPAMIPQALEMTAAEAARAIAKREITATRLAEACLGRIDSLDEQLKAWVYVDRESVLEAAAAADKAVLERRPLGPLHGVPIGVKDIYYTAGIPTRAGSEVYKDFVPDYDAASLTMLKRAGALMLGKAVTTEFACLDPSPTFNPWNPAHTPGGSSSGSAVAVASRMCPAALGSQTVGSVLRPAAYNGIVGFKPTFGRVSRYGVVPVSWNLDTVGWLVRSVEDAALLLQITAGPDSSDPVSSREPVGDYLSAVHAPSAPRIGLLRRYFYENADTETRRHLDQVAEQLSRSGAAIEELPMPDSIETAFDDQRLVMAVEAAAFHEPMYRTQAEDYQPKLRAMLADGLATDGISYSRALERRRQFTDDMRQLSARCDVMLTPATPAPSQPDRTNTGDPAFQGPWTSCGLPAISLPSGLAQSGLPMGIQLVASPFAESRLLSAASWCEGVMGFDQRPPV